MWRTVFALLAMSVLFVGCSDEKQAAPAQAPEAGREDVADDEANLPRTNLASLKIGNYDVQPFYLGELSQGQINVEVTGAEVGAVRVWVGPEDASGVMVIRAPREGDHYCGDMEMPAAIPADARLWIEVESPAGERAKGSVRLQN